jgi:hypothetical protein
MRTIEVKLYQFNELSDKAKEKARDWFREGSEFDGTFEPAETAAKLLGITFADREVKLMSNKTRIEPDIRYSGFSSQGDGASFVGRYEYRKGSFKAMAKEFPAPKEFSAANKSNANLQGIAAGLADLQKKHGYKITANIEQNDHRYFHSRTMSADVSIGDEELHYDNELTVSVRELLRDFAEWIYRSLEEQYNYEQSDEYVDDCIIANEYEFTEDGKRSCNG